MIAHTKAFSKYRLLTQTHLNFVVLVCYAVPALRADLKMQGTKFANDPDYFKAKDESKSQVAKYADVYQEELGRTTLITIFSYFESYIKEALREMIQFHGGDSHLKAIAKKRATSTMLTTSADQMKSKRKLQESPASAKKEKYEKHSKLLDKSGFRFPTELLAHFGIVHLVSKTDDKRGMRAWEVPDILSECLLFPLSVSDKRKFESLRSTRNEIAHGRAPQVLLKESLKAASEFHTLAAKIDKHIIEHFFVTQRFV